MNASRRSFLRTLAATGAGMSAPRAFANPPAAAGLRALAAGQPRIGTAVPTHFWQVLNAREQQLLADHFDSVTPENCMKWDQLCPAEGEYRFDPADRVIALAAKNGQQVVGHTLVFNREGCYPDWLFRDGEKEADARLVWKRIESHMARLMGRYQARIHSWDVLNEFVEDNAAGYRETDFTRILGDDYPVRLFKLAAAADPKAKLTYNDYGLEQPQRRKRILAFVQSLLDRGCRVDVVGSQSHLEIDDRIGEQIEASIKECAAVGVRCAFTELDVDVVPRKPYWNPQNRPQALATNPYADGAPDEVLERQAEVYRQFFQAVAAHRKRVDRVTFWGITDARSWLNHWPWKRVNHALLFDREGKPKPAYHAVATSLTDLP